MHVAKGVVVVQVFGECWFAVAVVDNYVKIVHILLQYRFVGYFRYVDDILITYKQNLTNTHKVLVCFNKLTPSLKFTIETETENKINFLDISITWNDDSLSFSIYRKPTTTDTIIPKGSCNPLRTKWRRLNS
jgi:hypothetical protein